MRRLPGIVEDDGPHGAIVGAARRRAPARLRARRTSARREADRAGRESGDGPEHVEALSPLTPNPRTSGVPLFSVYRNRLPLDSAMSSGPAPVAAVTPSASSSVSPPSFPIR